MSILRVQRVTKGGEVSHMPKNQTHALVVDCMYTALLQLMDEKAYHAITVTEIIRRAGVSRMAFYRNYRDKSEILIARFSQILQEFKRRCMEVHCLTERHFFYGLASALTSDPLLHYLHRAGLMLETFNIQVKLATELYCRIMNWDPENSRTQIVIHGKMGAFSGMLLYLAEHPEYRDLDAITDNIMQLAQN